MRALISGATRELVLLADILRKSGVEVAVAPAALPSDAAGFDAVIWSSEAATPDLAAQMADLSRGAGPVICDVAGGIDLCGTEPTVLPEQDLQSAAGLTDTTGFPDGRPVNSRVPFVAVSAALHAACALLAARIGRGDRVGQTRIEVSRYLSAVNALTTFLPSGLLGRDASRIGNRHPSSSPWNAYPTTDGWVLICTSKDEQWRRLCEVAADPALTDPRFDIQSARVEARDELDGLLSRWTMARSTADCAELLGRIGVPVGPILTLPELATEPNVQVRQPELARNIAEGSEAADLFKVVSLFVTSPLHGVEAGSSPAWSRSPTGDGPLSGLRVVEIGQFTTVPLAGRYLAHLGATVLKIEPPGGEPSRKWAPLLDGVSHYYTITNTGKTIVQLDMRDAGKLTWLRQQIAEADVLMENMRPGVLRQFGMSREELARINPRLILCSVSGFGEQTAYPGRAAFDTVIQGMSGIMDMTRSSSNPVKLGISAADILGSQVAQLAILSALLTGTGRFIDIAMLDIAMYAALCGLRMPEDLAGTVRVPSRSVREIAQNEAFREACLTTIPDETGVERVSVRIPYTIRQSFLPEVEG